MTSVFLSYDRDDVAKARSIAQALEKAGHSVWWDRHIRGGSRYAAEIEKALREADAVVVLWSRHSVQSDWVRDEAGKGRDSGRLVPARIDDAEPPLGFGQHHTTDLSTWRGRTASAQFKALLDAIECVGTGEEAVRPALSSRPTSSRPQMPIAIAALVALVIAGLVLWRPWERGSAVPVVTVAASGDSTEARELAANLLVQLGSFQSAHADMLQLVEPASGANADLTFKIGSTRRTDHPGAHLSLVESRDGTLLWSREFVQPGGNQADLRQQIAYSAGQVLRCATDALVPAERKLKRETLKLYLNGCADISALLAQDARLIIPTFSKVVDQEPAFAGGWAKLILAEMIAFRQSNTTDAVLRQNLRAHIDKARKMHPHIAEPALAEAWLQTPRPISGWMRFADEAVSKDPDHAEALINRATGLMYVGRMQEAVDDLRRAVRFEPLYPAARGALIDALGHSGAIAEARNELREAERLWPGASDLAQARFWFEYRYGDPNAALRMLQSGTLQLPPTESRRSFLEARIDPTRPKIEKAIADAADAYRVEPYGIAWYLQPLTQFGRTDEAANALLTVDPSNVPGVVIMFFRPDFRDLRRDPRFMAIAERFGLITYWRYTGKWPDFCMEPDLPYNCRAEAAKLAPRPSWQ